MNTLLKVAISIPLRVHVAHIINRRIFEKAIKGKYPGADYSKRLSVCLKVAGRTIYDPDVVFGPAFTDWDYVMGRCKLSDLSGD